MLQTSQDNYTNYFSDTYNYLSFIYIFTKLSNLESDTFFFISLWAWGFSWACVKDEFWNIPFAEQGCINGRYYQSCPFWLPIWHKCSVFVNSPIYQDPDVCYLPKRLFLTPLKKKIHLKVAISIGKSHNYTQNSSSTSSAQTPMGWLHPAVIHGFAPQLSFSYFFHPIILFLYHCNVI